MAKRRSKPTSHAGKLREIFVEIIVRAPRGRKQDLKPYVDTAHSAVMRMATSQHVFCGAIGRRGIVSERTFMRWMRKYKFYGK